MGAEVKPEVCIVGGGDVRRWWEGRGVCVAFRVELVVLGSWIRGKTSSAGCGEFIFRRTEFYFLAEDPPESLQIDIHVMEILKAVRVTLIRLRFPIVHLEDLRGSVVRAIAFTLAKSI